MAHHEASTTIDVAPNILFDYLSELDNLPTSTGPNRVPAKRRGWRHVGPSRPYTRMSK
jgi:hypothetical protein